MSKHTLSVLVDDTPGALTRVTALFSRRGFNIDSLAVGVTEHPETSRITLVVESGRGSVTQICAQLGKLVDVLEVFELGPGSAVERELVLVKVRTGNETRSQVAEIVQLFRAKIVDVSPEAVTVEATGSGDKLSAMLRMLEPYGIEELVQSGTIAIGRGTPSTAGRAVPSFGPVPWRATA
ncbi:acetolactate synthase small subunit [Streptomyces prunicolor]|jgi:acetolactate synthase-1/3 small subunit|uniref:acetolactate synthase small subunit n=1 Tax=Streptomyces prunicolor TaxID=67348 RepID=UPI00224E3660|nr:acetolactate synthase small subunit [Streptomyces prunicolor]MCX5236670.1 acetolactate synthase small subunit [Streptomyces prunicolor]